MTPLNANIRGGALGDTDGTLSRLIGRPTTPLVSGLRSRSLPMACAAVLARP